MGIAAACSRRQSPKISMDAVDGEASSIDVANMRRGGRLGPGKFLFRGQLFWQELLKEHVATNQLEFRIGMGEDTRNYARIPNTVVSQTEVLGFDDPRLLAAAVCTSEREDHDDVVKVLRAAASWGQLEKLRRLLSSCFVAPHACSPALFEAASSGHEEIVSELLRAGCHADGCDEHTRKTALHAACEKGHETICMLLLDAGANLGATDSCGRTPCELAREQDMGMMAKRLEKRSS
mmetsp:Transcript_45456/g.120566  ORF Transcript_45456/g.120566 Transcript_45456/m.120566 type:complete len:236 (-) Transcript_45456:138-845(-)